MMSSFGNPNIIHRGCPYNQMFREQCTKLQCSSKFERDPNADCSSDSLNTSSLGEPETEIKEKPPFSYVALITMAIRSSATGKVTLAEIYDFLTNNFEYFRTRRNRGWMNAVRHNLTLNDCFVKLPRDPLMHGKGSYWCIDPESNGMFNHGSLKRRRSRYTRTRREVEVVKDILLKDYAKNTRVSPHPNYLSQLLMPKTVSPYRKVKEPPRKKQYSNFSIEAILAKEPSKQSRTVLRWFGTEVWQC